MKTMQILRKTMSLGLMTILLLLFSANQAAAQDYDPSGTWSYEVEMPDMTLKGELMIKKTQEGFEVTVKSDVYGTLELEDVTFKEMVLRGSTEVDGGVVEFEWLFEADDLEGNIYTDDGDLTMTATRKKN